MTDVNTTLNSRQSTHGDFKDNGRIMQALKHCMRQGLNWPISVGNGLFTGASGAIPLTFEQMEALEMIQHKIGRILSGNPNEPDHWHDIAGYATLVENILRTGQSHVNVQQPSA